MATVIKIANKNINLDRLREELEAAGIPFVGAWMGGFHPVGLNVYEPNASTQVVATATGRPDVTADPGEIRLKFSVDQLTPAQEVTVDSVLSAHDHTLLSVGQAHLKADEDSVPAFIDAYNNWASLTPPEKDSVLREMVRAVARRIDDSIDL